MALESSTFLSRFPEYNQTDIALVEVKLEEALGFVDETWGTLADLAHGYMTAHLLASSPNGQNARLNNWNDRTSYLERFEDLQGRVGGAVRVIF